MPRGKLALHKLARRMRGQVSRPAQDRKLVVHTKGPDRLGLVHSPVLIRMRGQVRRAVVVRTAAEDILAQHAAHGVS